MHKLKTAPALFNCFTHLHGLSVLMLYAFQLISSNLFAQQSIQEIDEKTYNQYINSDWKNLAETGKQAAKNKQSFYYLNVRTGIALTQLQAYHSSVRFLTKAVKQNDIDFANERLMWAYSLSGNTFQANEIYGRLSTEAQKNSGYKTKRPLEFVYVEGGYKISDKSTVAGNSAYANLLLKHNITQNFDLLHGYTFLTRETPTGTYYQHQYLIAPTIHVKSGWAFDVALHGLYYSRKLSGDTIRQIKDSLIETRPEGTVKNVRTFKSNVGFFGNNNGLGISGYIGIQKKLPFVNVRAGFNYFYGENSPHRNQALADTGVRNVFVNGALVNTVPFTNSFNVLDSSKTTYHQGTFYADVAYTFPFWQERLVLGIKLFVPFTTTDVYVTASPYIALRVAKRAWLSAGYLYKGSYILSDNSSSLLFNTFDIIHARSNLTATIALTKSVTLYTTFIHENTTDYSSQKRYNFYALFTGLKFNLS